MICYLCGQRQEEQWDHASNGIIIKDTHICRLCELEIITTDVSDSEYQVFIEKIGQLWKHYLDELECV